MKGLEKFLITEKNFGLENSYKNKEIESVDIKISRLGIVARDYRQNAGNSDFSQSIYKILKALDDFNSIQNVEKKRNEFKLLKTP